MNTGLGEFAPEYIFQKPEFYEYLLVAHPSQEVNKQLKEEKENFSSTYKVSVAKKTLPHITVADFLAKEEMEETIIRYMRRILKLITYPHLSIARRLQQNIYEKAMFEYSKKTFYASFEVNELVLLKRKNQFDACTHVNVFKLPSANNLFN